MSHYQEKLNKALNTPGTLHDLMTIAETKTGIKRLYIAYGVIGLTVFWLAFGFGGQLLANSIGFVYPAYCSIKALETGTKKDDTKWLTYWVVFALFSVLEFFVDTLVGWVPFYWLTKCTFMIWCMAPIDANGSHIIYTGIIRPFFLKHESQLDSMVNKASSKAGNFLDKVVETAQEVSGDHIKIN